MAIYHCSIKIISRGKGKSAVAAAAYRSGESLTNEYDGITHDYTRKGGIVHTEILLPDNAPAAYADRSVLWNAVEKAEKAKNAQLAREIEIALPHELTREQGISLVREYVKEQFVNAGMCADICLHDKNDGNPHAHIMLTMRPIEQDGSWGAKQKKEYILDKDGNKIYWICPLVDESEKTDLAAAKERYDDLKKIFGDRAGLVHGKMKTPEKDAVMDAFAHGNIDILVATTVVEVGVDVPQATVMVIEHADRFGLAQLHQLRGRIGRGKKESACLSLYAGPLSETAKARLAVMRETQDGFRIAEEDLKLRGAGEVLGTKQSGMPEFKMADLATDADLLKTASNDAKYILNVDPDLTGKRGPALRDLLYLFAKDDAVRTIKAG